MFLGTLVDGVKQGLGMVQSPAQLYYGNFSNGNYDGLGFFQDKTESWKGEFKDGKRHGVGLYYKSPEKPYFAEFKDGELIPNAKVDSKKVNEMIKDLDPGIFKEFALAKFKPIEDEIEKQKKRVSEINFGNNTRPSDYEAKMDVIVKMTNEMIKEYNENLDILANAKLEYQNYCKDKKIEYEEFERRSGVEDKSDNQAGDAKVTKGSAEEKSASENEPQQDSKKPDDPPVTPTPPDEQQIPPPPPPAPTTQAEPEPPKAQPEIPPPPPPPASEEKKESDVPQPPPPSPLVAEES